MTDTTGDKAARAARTAEARRLREEQGRSASELARRFGVPLSTMRTWLTGLAAPGWTRRPNAKDDLRDEARTLRRQALSVPEIATRLGVSKSSAYQWVRDIPLDAEARKAIFGREHSSSPEHSRMMHDARNAKRDRRRAEVMASAAELPEMTGPELTRVGALIYWCEGSKSKPWRRADSVQFINSDPGLITIFLAFLRGLGVTEDRLTYRVSIHDSADVDTAVAWWARHVGVASERFKKPTLKRHNPKTVRHNVGDDYRGCLIIRVLKSRELYWTIEGVVAATIASLSVHGVGDRVQAPGAWMR